MKHWHSCHGIPIDMLIRLGKWVETALHQLVVSVEKALDHQETALGAFLFIERTFNKTSCDTMCDALLRHCSDYTIVRWIRDNLDCHVALVYLNGFSMGFAISRGCPQVVFYHHSYGAGW